MGERKRGSAFGFLGHIGCSDICAEFKMVCSPGAGGHWLGVRPSFLVSSISCTYFLHILLTLLEHNSKNNFEYISRLC
jgi:hypothetical protein